MLELEGRLVEVIFQNESNGYTVGVLEADDEEITIVGFLPMLRQGEYIQVKGDMKFHENYGEQLEVKEYRPIVPTTEDTIRSYLASGVIKGVGEKMADRIVDAFGVESLVIIEKDPGRLQEISGVGKKKAKQIIESYKAQNQLREIILFFTQYGVTPNMAVKIFKKYKNDAITVVQENPYRLADEIYGIGFKVADGIARSMGIAPDSRHRIHAGLLYTLNRFHLEGHTYIPADQLITATHSLLGASQERLKEAVNNLALDNRIQLENFDEQVIVYSLPYYYAETGVAKKVIELTQGDLEAVTVDLDERILSIEEKNDLDLASRQKEAVKEAVNNGMLVVTGGPGTGKTTTINTIIKLFESMEMTVVLAAPTGRASKRMTETSGKEAKTIHRLLEIGYSEEGDEELGMLFNRNEENPLTAEVIIIDEASMIDITLMNSFLKAVRKGTRVILVGDIDQLPSVGPGNVLRDIIDSGIVTVVRLNEIFRQAKESMIVVNAHKVNQGQYPVLNRKGKDFFFMVKRDKEEILATLLEVVKTRLPNHYEYSSTTDIQVLSPMKKGEVGTLNLNQALQEHLNPPASHKKEKKLKDKIFREGDKVMQMKNNYSLKWLNHDEKAFEYKGEGVFNGDLGYITRIDRDSEEVEVLFDDQKEVIYDFTKLDELDLAYATTVHKSQGSEFPVIVMPMTWGPPMLLTRNLFYTAITRAKELVVLIGEEKFLRMMIDNDKITTRYSALGRRLGDYRKMMMENGEK